MENSKQTIVSESMCDDTVKVFGEIFHVYFDYEYNKPEKDIGVEGGYDVTLRQVFDHDGAPVSLNEAQAQQAEWILADRLKDRGGK